MATTLRFTTPNHLSNLYPTRTSRATPSTLINCGPRSNRGPLVKGRVLSTEAIHTIQSLKRAYTKSNDIDSTHVSLILSRLLKADLLATLRELLRQDQCTLALHVFSTVRLEPWYSTDFTLYADITLALSRNAKWDDIDRLIEEMEMEGEDVKVKWEDKKGLGRLIRALIGANRRESTVRVYRVMKRNGWGVSGSGVEVDEYLAKVLSKGLRKFGEVDLAKEVELGLDRYLNACLGRVSV